LKVLPVFANILVLQRKFYNEENMGKLFGLSLTNPIVYLKAQNKSINPSGKWKNLWQASIELPAIMAF
jgi:hypothetical protein